VEADWPDAAVVGPVTSAICRTVPANNFSAFPTWMWRNTDVAAFVDGCGRSTRLPTSRKGRVLRFGHLQHGSVVASVPEYLDKTDREQPPSRGSAYGCLTPWQREPSTYGRAVLTEGYRKCEDRSSPSRRPALGSDPMRRGPRTAFRPTQNARLIASAERYYRIMYTAARGRGICAAPICSKTLRNVVAARGSSAKPCMERTIHIGDARHTGNRAVRDELNIGNLRENFVKKMSR